MNKKNTVRIIALIAVLAIALTALVACNSYKWDSVGGGDASAETLSNGGYFVKQGNYAYYVNGYDAGSTDTEGNAVAVDNTWGTPLKNGIVRVELNADGSVKADSAKLIVPQQIYNTYKAGGFAIFGEWIYYATPNNDEDKSGNASTTHTNFMRTKTDGGVTQLIGTINTRDSEYFFTPSRVLYRLSSTATDVNYIDFSGMKTDKNIDNGKGATTGVLVSNVESVYWNYDQNYTAGQDDSICDYLVYVETLTGDDSYEFCNNLCMIRYDGTGKRVLADKYTYLSDGEKANYTAYFSSKVFSFKTLGCKVESDTSLTLYYTKSVYLNSTETTTGLYCTTIDLANGFNAAGEKHLTNTDPTSVFPISYADGALIVASDTYYYYVKYDMAAAEFGTEWKGNVLEKLVVGRAATVFAVSGGYVYYTDSTGGAIYRINLVPATGDSPNEAKVLTAAFKSDWLNLEFDGSVLRFFDTKDYNYVHIVDLSTYAGTTIETEDTTFVGIMTSADAEAKKAAEEEANKD